MLIFTSYRCSSGPRPAALLHDLRLCPSLDSSFSDRLTNTQPPWRGQHELRLTPVVKETCHVSSYLSKTSPTPAPFGWVNTNLSEKTPQNSELSGKFSKQALGVFFYIENVKHNPRLSALFWNLFIILGVPCGRWDIVDLKLQLWFCFYLALMAPNRQGDDGFYRNSITLPSTVNFCYRALSPPSISWLNGTVKAWERWQKKVPIEIH